MRSLPNLIRLHRWRLDEKRRQLAELGRARATLEGDLERLDQELVRERDAAGTSFETAGVFQAFLTEVRARQARIAQSIEGLDHEIEIVHAETQEAFSELKSYELALEEHERRLAAERARREQAVLDEVALNRHRRRRQNSAA